MSGDASSGEGGIREVAPGVWMVPLSTPWPVGPVNVYVLEDDPLTLIDTGPVFGPAEADLDSALRQLGRRVEDLERVIVSHQHIDHWGSPRRSSSAAARSCARSMRSPAGWPPSPPR